jgi:sulfite reductase alpha subunit-like flavoprotein
MNGISDAAPSRTAIVLFGTETGTAQDLAYETSRILERHHFDTNVEELDNAFVPSLEQYHLVVFVLSTTGQGDFPANARKFWTNLLKKRLTSTFLSGINYALVGLGDSSYPKFNWAARKLEKRIKQLGATSLLDPCEADEQGEDSTDGAFLAWTQSFTSMLQTKYPLTPGLLPISTTVALPSKWLLSLEDTNRINTNDVVSNSSIHVLNGSLKTPDIAFEAVLDQNLRVTPVDHWQDVRFLKLRTRDKIEYYPGDAIAIRPMNLPDDVQHIIHLMQWDDVADMPLRCRSRKQTSRQQRMPDPSLPDLKPFTLRRLLTENLDINAIPRRSFFSAIACYTNDDMHKDRLLEFTDPQYLDEYYDYATRPRRSILEILQEFDSVKIPWQEAINVFPILRARQFSVASGGKQKEDGHTIELLVAIVKYRTVIKRIREGVCTRYLAQLPVGSLLNVVLKTEGRFHKPAELRKVNHILVGAGTGIAPLRALIHEKGSRERTVPNEPIPDVTLIFGCRNIKADYFFEEEWKQLEKDWKRDRKLYLDLITAFSRDQKQKVYVQDRIREQVLHIRTLLLEETTTIIVCGSSGAMPKAVRQAFVDVLTSKNTLDGVDALSIEKSEAYLAKLEKEGRYKQETW